MTTIEQIHMIEHIKDVVTRKKWNTLTIPQRLKLLEAISNPTLDDKEIYSRYLAIKKECLCTSYKTAEKGTAEPQTSETSITKAY